MAPLSYLALAVTAITTTTNALALPNWGGRGSDWGHSWNRWNHWGRDSNAPLPLSEVDNNGATPLSAPTSKPKYITLGLGYQNYTCSGTSYIQTVPNEGAIAQLYDITLLVAKPTKDTITRNTLKGFETCVKLTKCSPSVANGYCDSCQRIAAASFQASHIGEHFFEQVLGAQTPNFDVYGRGDYLSAKKAGSAKAPPSAYDGANGLGALDWLYLVPNASPRTHGLKGVYRVETAGGVAPSSCSKAGEQLSVPYAAEYWFYN